MKLTGNTILITGGGSGIGRGLAEALHASGNKVIIGGRRLLVLEETAAANAGMDWIELDTTSADSVTSALARLTSEYPDLNVVINNAGVGYAHDYAANSPIDQRDVQAELQTNIHGVLRVTDAFLPHLKSQSSATIINVSSALAFVPYARFPVYCATKAFVHSWTMSLRWQLKDTNVRVIELAPPGVKTDLGKKPGGIDVAEDPRSMPLDVFIHDAMAELATDEQELKIALTKALYSSAVHEKFGDMFAYLNQ